MIKNIAMKNCASYNDTGVTICDCKKINFIFGANGSGKSTISNFLMSQNNPFYSNCEIIWENNIHREILVYNKSFREKNFSSDNIAGIFTIGADSIDENKKLETLKSELLQKEKEQIQTQKTFDDKKAEYEKEFTEFKNVVWDNIFKKNVTDFKVAFKGFYNKKNKFAEEVRKKANTSIVSNETLESLKKRAYKIFNSTLETCSLINIDTVSLAKKISQIEESEIFSKIIIGNNDIPIAPLIQSLNNSDWVNIGRKFLRDDDICPFCQTKTITYDFKKQLEDYFSGLYEKDLSTINSLLQAYKEITYVLLSNIIEKINSDPNLVKFMEDYQAELDSKLILLDEQFKSNISIIETKIKEPSRKMIITSSKERINDILNLIEKINNKINEDNKIFYNYRIEYDKLVYDIWNFVLAENKSLIDIYLTKLTALSNAILGIDIKRSSLNGNIDILKNKIIEVNRNITSVQPTVDEINRLLNSYGFQGFKISPSTKENFYQIQRPDGSLATNTLSEGEQTFITFLYFMQMVKGTLDAAQVSNKRIIIIDDPICSLDSTILYIVSAMIKEVLRKVKSENADVEQIFILTHNVFFHKEASFVDGRNNSSRDVNFWILHKNENISTITPYEMDNPINSSYELLWKELKNNTNSSLITTQNIMRRIIESYFNLIGTKIDEVIINSFSTPEEQRICRSLFYWINDGSHTIMDDLNISNYELLPKYKEIFKKIFYQLGHGSHYEMMMN